MNDCWQCFIVLCMAFSRSNNECKGVPFQSHFSRLKTQVRGLIMRENKAYQYPIETSNDQFKLIKKEMISVDHEYPSKRGLNALRQLKVRNISLFPKYSSLRRSCPKVVAFVNNTNECL